MILTNLITSTAIITATLWCGITNSTNVPVRPEMSVQKELQTNWTGVSFQGKELGYVVTNHVATVTYLDTTNQFTLKTDTSNRAEWRPAETSIGGFIFPWHSTNIVFTNYQSYWMGVQNYNQ